MPSKNVHENYVSQTSHNKMIKIFLVQLSQFTKKKKKKNKKFLHKFKSQMVISKNGNLQKTTEKNMQQHDDNMKWMQMYAD